MGFTFLAQPRQDDWDALVDLPNPPHISPQLLKGTSEEMSPSALKREDTLVETKLGTSIKTFQRTISDEVGNAGPEHCRTKKALVLSMRTIQAFLRDPPSGLSNVDLRCFTQDRYRAVRQELEQQHIRSRLAVRMLEDMVRYSIMTVHEMCQDSDYSAPLGIDKNEISKMLKSLQQMYQEHRQAGDPIGTEAEFTSYVILLKAGQDFGSGVALSLAAALVKLPHDVSIEACVQWSLEVSRHARERNPARFFRLCEDATYVQACFVHMQFLEAVRQTQATMLLQRKTCLSADELREHLLLDTNEQLLHWLTAYKVTFEIHNDKLILDKIPPLSGRAPGADVSMQFLNKSQGKSLGDLASAQLMWPKSQQASSLQAHPAVAFGSLSAHDSMQMRSLHPESLPVSAYLKYSQKTATAVVRPPMQPPLTVSEVSATISAPNEMHVQDRHSQPSAQKATNQVSADMTQKLAKQRQDVEHEEAARVAAAQAVAAQMEAAAAARIEAAQRARQEQEAAMALVAKQAAQKRAEAEAIRAVERMEKMNLDEEYVRVGEEINRKDAEAWALAEEQYRLKLAQAERQCVDAEHRWRQQASITAAVAAQNRRDVHAAQYKEVVDAHGALSPQTELSIMEVCRQREEFQAMHSRVLQALLHMKAVANVSDKGPTSGAVGCGSAAEHVEGGSPAVTANAGDQYSAVPDRIPEVANPVTEMDVDRSLVQNSQQFVAAPAWHENRAVMTARICARPQSSISSAPAAFITKLLGPRRFKSEKGKRRR